MDKVTPTKREKIDPSWRWDRIAVWWRERYKEERIKNRKLRRVIRQYKKEREDAAVELAAERERWAIFDQYKK